MVGLSFFLFWVYGHRPLIGQPWQWADDGLYLRQSEAVLRWLHGDSGEWLGPYDALILAKAPLFAVWMAFLHILHLPLRLAEFALLLSLPWLLRAAVRPVIDLSWWQIAATGTLLIALPSLPLEQRLLRSVLQLGLSSACMVSGVGLILRARRASARLAPWAALAGSLFALAYLNREETLWLLPMMMCECAVLVYYSWRNRSWRRAVVATACLVGGSTIPVGLIATLNYHSYGVFVTTTRRSPEFIRAHQLLTRLEPGTHERYVPIRTTTRLRAYAVSPTFARLRFHLEGPATDAIARERGHLFTAGLPLTAREFVVTNFQFALQEAAFQAGAHTAPDSEVLFGAIARELESAIALGWINAGQRGPATLAAPFPGDYSRVLWKTVLSLRKLYALDGMVLPAEGVSSGRLEGLQRMENLTREPLAPRERLRSLSLPDVGGEARRIAYQVIGRFQVAAYGIATVALLAFMMATVARHRRDPTRMDLALAGLLLCGSLLAFSTAMAVIDLLGFPLLERTMSPYNNLGYAPLSVASAFGLVVLFFWLRPAFMSTAGNHGLGIQEARGGG
jgi:hypothetical protein